MSEQLQASGSSVLEEIKVAAGRITLLEALAEPTEAVGIDRSNQTSQAPDFDDQ